MHATIKNICMLCAKYVNIIRGKKDSSFNPLKVSSSYDRL